MKPSTEDSPADAEKDDGANQDARESQHWDYIVNGEKTSQEQLDKALLTLSGGGLALSITLIKDAFNNGPIHSCWLLIASWICFGFAILFMLWSFAASRNAFRERRDNFFAYFDDPKKVPPQNATVRLLNRLSAGAFVTAIATMMAFAAINMSARCDNAGKPGRTDIRRDGGGGGTSAAPGEKTQSNGCTCLPNASGGGNNLNVGVSGRVDAKGDVKAEGSAKVGVSVKGAAKTGVSAKGTSTSVGNINTPSYIYICPPPANLCDSTTLGTAPPHSSLGGERGGK